MCRAWHHNTTVTCLSSGNSSDQYIMKVLYPPVVSMRSRSLLVNEGSNLSIVCDYHSNPPELLSIQVKLGNKVTSGVRPLTSGVRPLTSGVTSDIARSTGTSVI